AERAVKLGVLVGKILEDAKLTVDQERVKAFIEETAQSYEDPQEVVDFFSNDQQQRSQIEAVVLEDQVVDYILQHAAVTDENISYQDLLKEQQAQRANR
ncbi:MAG: trigger factor, partial [Moraxellaceae bacterium]